MKQRRIKRLKEPKLFSRLPLAYLREKPSSTNWWSDPPKLIPIIISVFALCISYLSWQEANRGRIINEEINRPVLSVARMDQDMGTIIIPGSGGTVYSFYVDLKNTGKSTAKILKADVDPRLSHQTDTCKMLPFDEGALEDLLNSGDILPGIEEKLFGHALLTPACEKSEILRFELSITVTYSDVASGREYFQVYSERVDVSPSELRKKLDDLLKGPQLKQKNTPSN